MSSPQLNPIVHLLAGHSTQAETASSAARATELADELPGRGVEDLSATPKDAAALVGRRSLPDQAVRAELQRSVALTLPNPENLSRRPTSSNRSPR